MIENSLGYTNIHNATTWSATEIADNIKTARDGGWFDVFSSASIAGFSTLSAIGTAAGVVGSILYANYIAQQTKILSNLQNPNITIQQRSGFVNEMDIINLSNVSNFYTNNCNLNLHQGFINSNITTPQTISNLQTNNIVYNG